MTTVPATTRRYRFNLQLPDATDELGGEAVGIGPVTNLTEPVFVYDEETPPNGLGSRHEILTVLQNAEVSFVLSSYYRKLERALLIPGTRFSFEQSIARPQDAADLQETKHWVFIRGRLKRATPDAGEPGGMRNYNCTISVRQYLSIYVPPAASQQTKAFLEMAVEADTGQHFNAKPNATADVAIPELAAFDADWFTDTNLPKAQVTYVLGRNLLGATTGSTPTPA